MINPGRTPSYKIDVHQHFWNYNPEEYAWISDEMNILKRDFLTSDLRSERKGTGYEASISVQARQSEKETDWLLQLAEKDSSILGVVGWLDLCSPGFPEKLLEYNRNPLLKGLRHVLHDEADDDFMLRRDFMNGISAMGSTDLIYEILIFPKHLPNTLKLVSSFPDQRFVLDHIAKPDIRRNEISEWSDLIKQLARYPNVSCKASGMVTEAKWREWKPDDFYPYLNVIWNAFGRERIMIGSDWPVCLVAGTYAQVVCLAEGYFEKLGEDILRKTTSGNASLLYNL